MRIYANACHDKIARRPKFNCIHASFAHIGESDWGGTELQKFCSSHLPSTLPRFSLQLYLVSVVRDWRAVVLFQGESYGDKSSTRCPPHSIWPPSSEKAFDECAASWGYVRIMPSAEPSSSPPHDPVPVGCPTLSLGRGQGGRRLKRLAPTTTLTRPTGEGKDNLHSNYPATLTTQVVVNGHLQASASDSLPAHLPSLLSVQGKTCSFWIENERKSLLDFIG